MAADDIDQFTSKNEDDKLSLTYSTNSRVHDLPPMPAEHTDMHYNFQYQQERWAIFRSLPLLMKYDKTMLDYMKRIQDGTLIIPDAIKKINPPSLWLYYNTLP